MQLTYDVFTIKEVYGESAKLRNSFKDKVETAKVQVKASNDLRMVRVRAKRPNSRRSCKPLRMLFKN